MRTFSTHIEGFGYVHGDALRAFSAVKHKFVPAGTQTSSVCHKSMKAIVNEGVRRKSLGRI